MGCLQIRPILHLWEPIWCFLAIFKEFRRWKPNIGLWGCNCHTTTIEPHPHPLVDIKREYFCMASVATTPILLLQWSTPCGRIGSNLAKNTITGCSTHTKGCCKGMIACMEPVYGIHGPFHALEDQYWPCRGVIGVHLGPFWHKRGKNGHRNRMQLLHGME